MNHHPVSFFNYQANLEKDATRVGLMLMALAILVPLLQRTLLGPLADYCLPQDTLAIAATRERRLKTGGKGVSKEQYDKARRKFVSTATKFVSYFAFVMYGCWTLWGQQDWLWQPFEYYRPFAPGKIPASIINYYHMQAAYYLYSCGAIFFEPKLKDRYQMLLHHIVTLVLIVTSYYCNTIKYGITIMLLHDVADPLMEAAKLFNYCRKKAAANVLFLAFASVFIYTRDYLFPRYIINAVWLHGMQIEFPLHTATVGCLTCLWVLHIIWTVMIFRVLLDTVIGGSGKGDVREED